jgi:hypothetical protein
MDPEDALARPRMRAEEVEPRKVRHVRLSDLGSYNVQRRTERPVIAQECERCDVGGLEPRDVKAAPVGGRIANLEGGCDRSSSPSGVTVQRFHVGLRPCGLVLPRKADDFEPAVDPAGLHPQSDAFKLEIAPERPTGRAAAHKVEEVLRPPELALEPVACAAIARHARKSDGAAAHAARWSVLETHPVDGRAHLEAQRTEGNAAEPFRSTMRFRVAERHPGEAPAALQARCHRDSYAVRASRRPLAQREQIDITRLIWKGRAGPCRMRVLALRHLALIALAPLALVAGCGGEESGSGSITLTTEIDFAAGEMPRGTFDVTEGERFLGCSSGTFVDLEAEGGVNKILTCDEGDKEGTFTIFFTPPEDSPWRVVEETGDFSGLEGEGEFSVEVNEEEESGVETLTGEVSY